eukprot:scaffold4060_cov190-Amphora_coffeaeformis.AAC.15
MPHLRPLLLVACSLLFASNTIHQADAFTVPLQPHDTRPVSLTKSRSSTPWRRSDTFTPPLLFTSRSHKVSITDHDGANDDDDSNLFFPPHYAGLFFDKYLDWCHRKPFRTKSVSAMFILLLGDVMAQFLEASSGSVPFRLNLARTRGFALCGLLFEGPWMHFWYEQVWK